LPFVGGVGIFGDNPTMSRVLRATFALAFVLQLPCLAEESEALRRVREVLEAGAHPVRIVCLGDSVTAIHYHSGGRKAYPEIVADSLREHYPAADLTLFNAGRSGHTSTNGLARLSQDVLVHRPHLVTVMFGLNDVAKSSLALYRKDMAEIVRRCRAANAEVILCTPNAVDESPERPVAEVAAVAEAARALALELKVPLCDVHASFVRLRSEEPAAWRFSMSDEIHPNLRGHRRIAGALLRAITGRDAASADEAEPDDPLRLTREKLESGRALRVLAMPPADRIVAAALKEAMPGALVEVTSWPVDGLDARALAKDAAHRVRAFSPDLVVLCPPRDAGGVGTAEGIRDQLWIAYNSMSRGLREWDVVRVHPDVFEPVELSIGDLAGEAIKSLSSAQDVALVEREPGDAREGEAVFSAWMRRHLRDGE
jgi:lysophospholipase L1-like esterase